MNQTSVSATYCILFSVQGCWILKQGAAQKIRNRHGVRITAVPTPLYSAVLYWQGECMIMSFPVHSRLCEDDEFLTQSKVTTQSDSTFRNCRWDQ